MAPSAVFSDARLGSGSLALPRLWIVAVVDINHCSPLARMGWLPKEKEAQTATGARTRRPGGARGLCLKPGAAGGDEGPGQARLSEGSCGQRETHSSLKQ